MSARQLRPDAIDAAPSAADHRVLELLAW